jgi:hypothetical protein
MFFAPRGFHPFDVESSRHGDYSSAEDSQRFYPSQFSQFSMEKEVQTKRRIVDGAVNFPSEIWDTMLEGM